MSCFVRAFSKLLLASGLVAVSLVVVFKEVVFYEYLWTRRVCAPDFVVALLERPSGSSSSVEIGELAQVLARFHAAIECVVLWFCIALLICVYEACHGVCDAVFMARCSRFSVHGSMLRVRGRLWLVRSEGSSAFAIRRTGPIPRVLSEILNSPSLPGEKAICSKSCQSVIRSAFWA